MRHTTCESRLRSDFMGDAVVSCVGHLFSAHPESEYLLGLLHDIGDGAALERRFAVLERFVSAGVLALGEVEKEPTAVATFL